MNSALLIACKELRLNLRSARFFVGFLLCLLFVPFVMTIGIDDYRMQRSIHKDLTTRADSILYKDTYVWSGVRPTVVKRPELLSIFSKGVTSNVGVDNRILLGEYPFFSAPNGDASTRNNPLLNAFFRLDLMGAMGIVLSLLALVFSYDTFSREREEGTMRMIFAQPIRRSSFLCGKLLGVLFTVLPLLVFCFLLALGGLLLQPDIRLLPTDWTGIGWLAFTSLLYLLLFALIGMLISLCVRQSNTAILVSLLCWLSFQFVIPPVVTYLSQSLVRVPLYEVVSLEMRALNREFAAKENQIWQEAMVQGGLGKEEGPIMNQGLEDGFNEFYGTSHRVARMRTTVKSRTEPLRIWYADRKWQLQYRFLQQVMRQQQMQQRLSWISPSRMFGQASQLLCHTSPQDHLAYMKEVRAYRYEVIGFFTERRVFGSLANVTTQKWEELIDDDVFDEMTKKWEAGIDSDEEAWYWVNKMKERPLLAEVRELPVFRQSAVTCRGQLQAVSGLWAGFVLLSIALFAGLVRLSRRYDVR